MTREIEYTLENLADYEAVAVTRLGPYPISAPAAWTALWDWVNKDDSVENIRRKIGFGLDNPSMVLPINLRYRACVVLHDMPEEIASDASVEKVTVPGGAYAVHRMQGPYLGMPATFAFLIRQVGHEHTVDVHRPFQEIYLNDPSQNPPEEWLTDLCVPVGANT